MTPAVCPKDPHERMRLLETLKSGLRFEAPQQIQSRDQDLQGLDRVGNLA